LKAKDWKQIDRLILEAIRKTFQEESIRDEVIDHYIEQSKGFVFSKTKDKRLVAKMNKSCDNVYLFYNSLKLDSLIQDDVSIKVSNQLVGDGKNQGLYPNEKMYEDLENLVGQPIFRTEAYALKVTLQLENQSVWRRITVPLTTTFHQLHTILQVAFSWQDSHLHDFSIYPHYEKNVLPLHRNKPVLNLVSDEEAFNYQVDVPMKLETGFKLIDILPASIVYNYDFGDDWNHMIEVEKVVEDYRLNYPICTEGAGNSPPEDVGGEGGYEEFQNIMENVHHPDH